MKAVPRHRIVEELDYFCSKFPTYTQAAAKLGVTLAQLSSARNDESSAIPAKILDKLGYASARVYVHKGDLPAKPVKAAKPAAPLRAQTEPQKVFAPAVTAEPTPAERVINVSAGF